MAAMRFEQVQRFDFSVSWDRNVVTKEDEKNHQQNYTPLEKEIRNMHQVSTKIVSLMVGCLDVVSGQGVFDRC